MTRRSSLSSSQRIDLVQRRRTRGDNMYSEQPVPLDIRRLPGTGDGGGAGITDFSWLSPEIGWMDATLSWIP